MTSYLRPDEKSTNAQIEKSRGRDQAVKSGLKAAASALTGAGAIGLSSKIAPFLSQYISPEIAVKGISKVSPKIGEFLQKGMAMGLPVQEGLDFVKENLGGVKQDIKKGSGPKNINVLGQFSPELQQFVEEKIQSGKSPDHAAALAMNQAELSDIVRGVEAKTKKRFTEFVREIYEGKAVDQGQSQAALQNPSQGMQAPQQQQGGNVSDQDLMSAFQKIMSM